jgi:hypothetical protein
MSHAMLGRVMSVFVIAMLIVSASAIPVLADDSHEGRVSSAGMGKLMIMNRNGETETFTVPDSCKISRNGKEAKLDELAIGDAVKVEANRNGENLVAKSIEARAAE